MFTEHQYTDVIELTGNALTDIHHLQSKCELRHVLSMSSNDVTSSSTMAQSTHVTDRQTDRQQTDGQTKLRSQDRASIAASRGKIISMCIQFNL